MTHYRRSTAAGASHFFTVVSHQRQAILCDPFVRYTLREAIKYTKVKHYFTIDAWVLLPDHLHCIWTLPENDSNYSVRWSLIKRFVSYHCATQKIKTCSQQKHREAAFWQRRFWEHQIRDEQDFQKHTDYIHYNPVKHGLCNHVADWPYSTFHRYVRSGIYSSNWGEDTWSCSDKFGE